MDEPDDLPRRKIAQKPDLDPMSIGEMREYIVELNDEILRVEADIAKKERHRGDIEGIFKS